MTAVQVSEEVEVEIENVGGIGSAAVTLRPGVNALAGRNATNRTSFLQAVMAALGSDDASLKSDAEEGRATLRMGEETYARTLSREGGRGGGSVVTGGDPYLDDPGTADLFAFLLESNEARQAVARSDDLRELVMRPVDTEAIQAEIDDLVAEKRRIEDDLADLDALADDLPDLRAERDRLADEIAATEADLAAVDEEIEAAEVEVEIEVEEGDDAEGVEDASSGKPEHEAKLDELQQVRSNLEAVRQRLTAERESLDALREERVDLEEALDEVGDVESDGDAEAEIDRLRDRKQALDAELTDLQSVIQFNEEQLAGETAHVAEELADGVEGAAGDDGAGGDVTDRLLGDAEPVVCWTCGTSVERGQMESTVEHLREFRQAKLDERTTVTDELDALTAEVEERERRRERRRELEGRIGSVESEIDERETGVEELVDRREDLEAEIDRLEEEVAELKDAAYSEVLELHERANELEFELGRLAEERDEILGEVEDVEGRLDERGELEERREGVQDRLAELRTRIDRVEREAVEAFNEHMATVLDLLAYENVERVWLERTEREVPKGRGTTSERAFDLHVVRRGESGAGYEDTVDHLSESEREVTGLVFALAGYLVHDLHEEVPFVLLDSLEAIDSERIAALVEYFAEYAPYLVVALLHEDAAALDEEHYRVTEI